METGKNNAFAVEMVDICKYFGDFCALDKVSLQVRKGTIHALLGENGAGKSTLMNVLYGLYQAESGHILINGVPSAIKSPNTAIHLGIGMVHQHFMLVDNFTVAENIMLGSEAATRTGILDYKKIRSNVIELSKQYGLNVDPDEKIENISVGMQQRVEILKALYRGVEILILDEPTAVLTPQEIGELVGIMRRLAGDGKTIIIITHKLREIKQSSEYCTVIRRGRYIDTVQVNDVTEADLASMMVGRQVALTVEKQDAKPGDVVFEVNDLVVQDTKGINKVNGLSFQVRKGEILGIAGIDGNGQTELVEAITSLVKTEKGSIRIHGKAIENTTPRKVIDSKISVIPEDRQKQGLIMDFTVAENLIFENYRSARFSSKGVLDKKKIYAFADDLINRFDIRPANSKEQPAKSLSGGNQQKVIIAREITNNPDILIAVQPTRGLDVGAIEYVHKALIEQRDRGKAVLLISLELDEIMNISDRIAVIYGGKIVGEMPADGADENEIGLLMAGGGAQ